MKTFVTLLALTVIGHLCHAQIDFQPGYYLRNDGTRISCLIKDYGWPTNPTRIVCKSSPGAATVTIGMDSITEFGVGNSKYQRCEVDVETSGEAVDELTSSPIPKYRHEKAFLKLLVEGRASLYLYQHKRLTRYFFRLNSAAPKPLVSKQYLGEDGIIHVNQEYIMRLSDSLSCSAPDFPNPIVVRYEAKSLTNFFIAYNNCVKSAYTDYWTKTGKTAFHLNIRPGIDLSSLILKDNSSGYMTKYSYGSKASFRIGAEAELILPIYRNKWSVLLEPEYRSYNSSSGGPGFEVDYKAIQVLLGARYYMFIGGQSKLYLAAELFTNFQLNSTLQYEGNDLSIQPRLGEAVSAGFRYGDRFSIELNYTLPEQILDNYYFLRANLTATSLIVSYRIL
jgi:hypothetical protein